MIPDPIALSFHLAALFKASAHVLLLMRRQTSKQGLASLGVKHTHPTSSIMHVREKAIFEGRVEAGVGPGAGAGMEAGGNAGIEVGVQTGV